jgi:dinuclear metal center YbgI/SA1388 family protein
VARLTALTDYTDRLLHADAITDYCPNGLQVEGRPEVRRIVSGVTASLALLEAAVAAEADAILVHHGYFWKGEEPRLVGMKGRRIRFLLRHEVSLLAYHLPLDVHPELGNNAQLAARLGIEPDGSIDGGPAPLIRRGHFRQPLAPDQLAERLDAVLQRPPVHVGGGPAAIRTIAWCTGAGQRFVEQAAQAGVDAFLSGEISEPTAHVARECGLHYFAAGHHATERFGVQALGEHLAERFDLDHRFIDIDNPA